MKIGHESIHDAVLERLEKTYPDWSLCSYDDLGRMYGDFVITNTSRFWNERSIEVLSAFHEINGTLHRFPDSYLRKIILSPQFSSLFEAQVFAFLEKKIQHEKNPNAEDVVLMMKLCSIFLRIALNGMKQSMPSEFTHILEPKLEEVFTLMSAINQYTKRIAPSYAKSTDFPFDLYKMEDEKQKKSAKVTSK